MDHPVVSEMAEPRPTEWHVECPTCGAAVECEMREDDHCVYRSGDTFGDPFVTCGCGTVIEPTPVTIATHVGD